MSTRLRRLKITIENQIQQSTLILLFRKARQWLMIIQFNESFLGVQFEYFDIVELSSSVGDVWWHCNKTICN